MGQVLVLAVRPLAGRHGHEHPVVVPFDHLEPADDETVLDGDAGERLQLGVVPQRDTDLGNAQHGVGPLAGRPSTGSRRAWGNAAGWECVPGGPHRHGREPAATERATWTLFWVRLNRSATTSGERAVGTSPKTADPLPDIRTCRAPARRRSR